MVSRSVGLSVCLSVGRSVCQTSEPCNNGLPIKMPFELRTRVGPGNHVLDGGPDSPMGRGNFWRAMGCPIVKYRDTLRLLVQKRLNRSRYRLGFGLRWTQGIMSKIGSSGAEGRCHGNHFLGRNLLQLVL